MSHTEDVRDKGASPAGSGSCRSDQAASHLDPSGFDPLRETEASRDVAPPEKVSGWVRWVRGNTKAKVSPFQARAIDVLCLGFGSPWNSPWNWEKADWDHADFLSVCTYAGLATFDNDKLTRLVLAAHDECIRVSLTAAGPRYIRIMLHPRSREGGIGERHPSIEQAIAQFRGAAQ